MTIERELRDVADALSTCRARPQDPQTMQTLTWASMQVHHIARQLRGISLSLVDGEPEAGAEQKDRVVSRT